MAAKFALFFVVAIVALSSFGQARHDAQLADLIRQATDYGFQALSKVDHHHLASGFESAVKEFEAKPEFNKMVNEVQHLALDAVQQTLNALLRPHQHHSHHH